MHQAHKPNPVAEEELEAMADALGPCSHGLVFDTQLANAAKCSGRSAAQVLLLCQIRDPTMNIVRNLQHLLRNSRFSTER